MVRAQDEFRAELQSLRWSVIRSIQQTVPSNVDEGLATYQRLLQDILKRFSLLYGNTPRLYSRYLIGQGAGGEQMEWLRSDYEDFVEQALIARSIPTLRSVIGGLLGAAKVCINEDDSAALVLFLDLMKYAWQSAKNDDELRTRRSIVRDQVLISLDHLTYESIASSLDGGRKTPGELHGAAADQDV